MSQPTAPDLAAIRRAAARLEGRVHETPLAAAPALSAATGRRVLVKLENRQVAGCFKPRGALNAALAAAERERPPGLVTGSSGNHGQAVALAAQELGVPCLVVVPEDVSSLKRAAIEARGAEVLPCGRTSEERLGRAVTEAERRGWLFVPPYDHDDVIAGQGTVGLELARQMPEDVRAVAVPVGGGGLAAGVGLALSVLRPAVTLVVVEPADADDLRRSLVASERLSNDRPSTSACDGLRNTSVGERNWEVLARLRPSAVAVTEESVARARELLLADGHGPVEPSGAAAAAALLAGQVAARGDAVVAIVSGANAPDPPAGASRS